MTPLSQSVSVVQKVCGACGEPVRDSAQLGKEYWCNLYLRVAKVKIIRTPAWKQASER